MRDRACSVLAAIVAEILLTSAVAPPQARAAAACFPDCRAGFICAPSGTCVSACNPPCAAGEQCTAELTCVSKRAAAPGVPAQASPAADPTPTAPPAPPVDPAAGGTGPVVSAVYPPAPSATPALQASPPPPKPYIIIASVGVHSEQDSDSSNLGPGLRIGALAGGRVTDQISINGELAYDLFNIKNVPAGVNVSSYGLQLSAAPFYEVPGLTGWQLLLGPKLGLQYIGSSSSASGSPTISGSSTALLLGLNAAAFVRLSDAVALGGLLNAELDKWLSCSNSAGPCSIDGWVTGQVISATAAVLF
jgi:hypothetical protein